MIPLRFWSKMSVYNIKFNGLDVKATVLDQDSLINIAINELTERLCELKIVGIDVKGTELSAEPQLLLLYVKDSCLIIQLGRMPSHTALLAPSYTALLAHFLKDQTICFVGTNLNRKVDVLRKSLNPYKDSNRDSWLRYRVDIGELAARVLKEADLQWCDNLVELAKKSGFEFKEAADYMRCPNWAALCFSEEEVKCAMRDVYLSYSVGNRLLSML